MTKVLILSTYHDAGGAAIAAQRLCQALNRNGVSATVMVAGGGWIKGRSRHFILERLRVLFANRLSRQNLFAVDLFSDGEDITGRAAFAEADVIHLHWVNQGFVSFSTMQKILQSGKRIVWTMHDAWCSTGICHLTMGCKGFENQCGDCRYLAHPSSRDLSHRVWEKKKQLYSGHDITFVTCSRWLMGEAKRSSLLADQDVRSVPNPLDTSLYRPLDKADCRRQLGLPENKRLLLFVAQSVTNPYKGMDYLIEALQKLADADTALVMLGGGDTAFADRLPGIDIHALGYVRDAETMCRAYNAADAFVLPSLSENLPNTIMESMACGTPCVGFDVGGIPEMIDHRQNGYVAAYRDSADLAAGLRDVLEHADRYAAVCLEKVMRCYSEKAVAELYLNIYNSCARY